ncbi:MAG TPA: hypothetical protein VKA09_12600 [Nitrososphaeraceae archaeon]|nr:hypothetical protein [Nitrososphaeraceae archaeon]
MNRFTARTDEGGMESRTIIARSFTIPIIFQRSSLKGSRPRDREKVAMGRFVDQTDFELRLVRYGKWVSIDIHDKKVVKSSKSTIAKVLQ